MGEVDYDNGKGNENWRDGTTKTFHMVMGTWYVNPGVKTTNKSDDKEEVGAESGYHLDRGQS